DDELVIAQLAEIEVVLHSGPERGDQVADLLVAENLVHPRLLDVQNLAADRHDGLEATVSPLLRGSAGRVALDDVQLAVLGIVPGAIRELSGQRSAIEDALAPRELARLAGGFAGTCRGEHLVDD